MAWKMRFLGFAALLALAISAVGAQAALAVEGIGEAGSYPVTVTGSQVGKVTTSVGAGVRSMVCSIETFKSASAISAPTSTLMVIPTYSGCTTSPGGGPASISMEGCGYSITAKEKLTASTGKGNGSLVCPAGKAVKIIADSSSGSVICEWSAPSQGPLESATWENKTGGTFSDVLIVLNLSGIQATVVRGTIALCGAAVGKTVSATDIGEITATADSVISGTQVSALIS